MSEVVLFVGGPLDGEQRSVSPDMRFLNVPELLNRPPTQIVSMQGIEPEVRIHRYRRQGSVMVYEDDNRVYGDHNNRVDEAKAGVLELESQGFVLLTDGRALIIESDDGVSMQFWNTVDCLKKPDMVIEAVKELSNARTKRS